MGSLGDEDSFIIAHASPHVHYLTFHLWPSNWGWIDHHDPHARLEPGLATSLAYIDRHIDIAGRLGKPIVLSEFGLHRDGGACDPASAVTARDRFYRAVFDRLLERAKAGGAIAGSNFRAWGGRGRSSRPDGIWQAGDPSPAIRRRRRRGCSRCRTARTGPGLPAADRR